MMDKSHKPFDIVTCGENVGFIVEVNVMPDERFSYCVKWFITPTSFVKTAWFDHDELTVHGNFFEMIAEKMCHPFGNNAQWVSKIFNA